MTNNRKQKGAYLEKGVFRNMIKSICMFFAASFHKLENLFLSFAVGVSGIESLQQKSADLWDADTQHRLQEAPQVLSGLMAWEIPIADYIKPKGLVGIVGCGAGRDMIGFARLGFTVDGVDISEQATNAAKGFLDDAGIQGNVYCGDISYFTFPRSEYDAFVFSWYTYCYVFPASNRIKALKNLHAQLADDGCIVLTTLPYHGGCSLMVRVAQWVGALTGNQNPPEKGDCFKRNGNYEHHFTRDELETEARAAGFTMAEYREDLQAIAVLKKKKNAVA